MKIIVPIHQVFDPEQIRVSSQGRVVTEGATRIIEPASRAALEEALRLKDETGAAVDVVALGGAEVEESLREAQAMGADQAYLVSDEALNGGDAGADAYALSVAIQRIGGFDLVMCGEGGAVSGPMLAEFLGLPQVTDVVGLAMSADGRAAGDQRCQGGRPQRVGAAAGGGDRRRRDVDASLRALGPGHERLWRAHAHGVERSRPGPG